MLLREKVAVYWRTVGTNKYTLGRIQSFGALKLVLHIESLDYKELNIT
jgi:hypothetical protein